MTSSLANGWCSKMIYATKKRQSASGYSPRFDVDLENEEYKQYTGQTIKKENWATRRVRRERRRKHRGNTAW